MKYKHKALHVIQLTIKFLVIMKEKQNDNSQGESCYYSFRQDFDLVGFISLGWEHPVGVSFSSNPKFINLLTTYAIS